MKLDEIEADAKSTVFVVEHYGMDSPSQKRAYDLARAVLAMVPVVRDAMSLYDRAQSCVDRPWMGCPIDHSTIDSAFWDSIDKLRAAMEEP